MPVTLAEIERAVMRRTGPFTETSITEDVTRASSTARAYTDKFKSTLNQGGVKGLWLLRRGYDLDGVPIPSFDQDDRVRRVKLYTPASGALDPDNPWNVAPAPREAIELCNLPPDDIIRPAVLAGLKRCKIRDTVKVTLRATATDRNLGTLLPWLEDESQIVGVSYLATGSNLAPAPVRWFRSYARGGSVWLSIAPDPFPANLWLTVNRPADTIVNGIDSDTGPTDDLDELPVDLARAAAAGHIECWRIGAALMQEAAKVGYTISMEKTADEHSRQQRRFVKRSPAVVQLSRPMLARVL